MLVSLLVFLSISHENESQHVREIIETVNDFGFDLLKSFHHKQKLKDDNLFYSPTSIVVSLAIVFLGSGGNTAHQLAKTLKWYSHEFEDVHLALKFVAS